MVRDAIECENAHGGAGVQKAEDRNSGQNVPRGLASRQDAWVDGRLEIIISIYTRSQGKGKLTLKRINGRGRIQPLTFALCNSILGYVSQGIVSPQSDIPLLIIPNRSFRR
jgi:hypothetical protein